jgi:hypothetical protein
MSVYLLLPVLCIYFYAGLDGIFSTHNPLSLSDHHGEIVFERGSRAHTEPLFNLNKNSNLQINLSFEYNRENLDRGGVIFELYGPSTGGELILWQWKNQLVLMSGDDYNARLRKPRVWVDLPKDHAGPYDVSILVTQNSLNLNVEDNSFSKAKSLKKPIEFDAGDIRVVVGANKNHRFPWAGKIQSFSLHTVPGVGDGVLDHAEPVFVFDQANLKASEINEQGYIDSTESQKVKLYVGSRHLKIGSRSLQTLEKRLDLPNISPGDLLLNFIGFFPMGILVFILCSARGLLVACACSLGASFLLSLSIELMQLAIPFRDPSQMDLLLNTLGGGIGAVITGVFMKMFSGKENIST